MLSNSGFTARRVGLLCFGRALMRGRPHRTTRKCMKSICLLAISETHNETYLPTFRHSSQAHPWLSRTHGYPQRPCRTECPSRQRPQAPGCLSVCLSTPDRSLLVTGDFSQPDRSQPAFATDFARNRRIVKTDEFSSVFRLRPTNRTAHFVLYTRSNGLTTARLGVVAAKRLAPRAVTRNMIKRIVRELFRQSALPAMDCIVRLSKPVNTRTDPAASSVLKKCLRAELQQLLSFPHGDRSK